MNNILEAELTAQAEPTKEVKIAAKAVPASTAAPSDAVASPQDATIASTGAANTGTSHIPTKYDRRCQSLHGIRYRFVDLFDDINDACCYKPYYDKSSFRSRNSRIH